MKLPSLRFALILFAALLPLPAGAQVPSQPQQAIIAPTGVFQTGARLGTSVAVDGGYMVAGAPDDPSGTIHFGVVKVFDTTTGAQLFRLPNAGKFSTGYFGATVAISGTRVVVGDPDDTTAIPHDGSAFVFDLASATPTVPVLVLKRGATPGNSDNFGSSVAIEGTRVVVGAAGESTGAQSAGSAYVYDLGSATPDLPVVTLHNPSPVLNASFGISAAVSGSRVVVGAYEEAANGVKYTGSAFVYDLSSATPAAPVFTLNNPAPTSAAGFGWSVAISGTRLAIGAYFGFVGSGKVFGYDLASATPTMPVATFTNPSPSSHDTFGSAVALSGTRVVIGAYGAGAGSSFTGSAYIYDFGTAMPVLTLQKSSPVTDDYLGYAVAISGGHVVVGVPMDDNPAIDAGNAYLYDLDGSAPTVPLITQNDPGPALGAFGGPVAICGMRVVVGAPGADTATPNALSAFVYDLTSATPAVPILALHRPTAGVGIGFGTAVAISGTRVVVSAPYDSSTEEFMGIVCIYDLTSATPTVPVLTINDPNPSPNSGTGDEFGQSLAISGSRLLVGAPTDSTDASEAGRAYVYDLDSSTPATPAFVLRRSTPAANNWFGYAVGISGTNVAVGTFTGSGVYIFDLNSATPTVPTVTLTDATPQGFGNFGSSVGISDARVVVGAYNETTGSVRGGSVFVYDLAGATPTTPVATLTKPNPASGDYFGTAVKISGTRVVVGASQDDTGTIDAGRAFVFDLSGTNPTVPIATLDNPTPAIRDHFGNTVVIDGTTVVIGTPNEGTVIQGTGAIYIFGPNPNDLDNNGLLDSWEMARFGNAIGHLATDDDDHDGFINLLKEAFNPDPLGHNTAAAIPAPVNEGGYLTITIAKQPGVTYQVLSAATPDPAAFTSADTTVLINNATTLKVRDNFLIGTTPGRFLRVKVMAAP